MSRFRLSPGGRRPHEPWFHIGSLEVGTTWLVVFLSIAGVILFAVAGGGGRIEMDLTHWPGTWQFTGAKPWTILTWPVAYPDFSFSSAIAIFFFWYFGLDLERDLLGRNRFAILLVLWTVILGAGLWLVDQLNDTWGTPLYALQMLELLLVLLWSAEWPHRMFFFNIPAWVVGVFIVVVQLADYMGHRQWDIMFDLLIGIVVGGFAARQLGLLADYPWIPQLVGRRPRRARLRSVPQPKPAPQWPAPGPWTPPVSQVDEDRMNELLEKIHANGADSLTDRERSELNELRLRRRGGR